MILFQLMFQVAMELLLENEEDIRESQEDGQVLILLAQYTKHVTADGKNNTVCRTSHRKCKHWSITVERPRHSEQELRELWTVLHSRGSRTFEAET